MKPIFNNNEIQHEYDSLGQEDSIFKIGENTNFSLDFGIKQKYKRYFVDFCINYHLKEFGRFDNISKIKKQLFTVRILLGVTL